MTTVYAVVLTMLAPELDLFDSLDEPASTADFLCFNPDQQPAITTSLELAQQWVKELNASFPEIEYRIASRVDTAYFNPEKE